MERCIFCQGELSPNKRFCLQCEREQPSGHLNISRESQGQSGTYVVGGKRVSRFLGTQAGKFTVIAIVLAVVAAGGAAFIFATKGSNSHKVISGSTATVPTTSPHLGTTILTYTSSKDSGSRSLSWSPDGRHIVSGNQVWDATTGKLLFTYNSVCSRGDIRGVAWSPDGKYIVYSGDQVVDATTGRLLSTYYGLRCGSVTTVAWSPDGKQVVSGNILGTVAVWDPTTGKTLLTYPEMLMGGVETIAWSPDGSHIAIGGQGESDIAVLQVWDTTRNQILFTYQDPNEASEISSLAWSADGKRIAAAALGGNVQILDARTGNTVLTLNNGNDSPESAYINAVAWSPDGSRIATGGDDHLIKLWDATTGQTLYTYRGHIDDTPEGVGVRAIAWSPDGTRIASAGYTRIKIWVAG